MISAPQWPMPQDEVLSALLAQLRRYGEKTLVREYETLEKGGKFPEEVIKELSKMGLFGLIIPAEFGGSEMGAVAAAYVAREIAYWWPGLHLIWTAHNLAAEVIIQIGSEEQKKRILPRMATGEWIGAFGLTTPGGGSDARATKTETELEHLTNEYMITGSTCYITNPKEARVFVTLAHIAGTPKHELTAFVVETNYGLSYPGITVIHEEKHGFKCASFCRVEMNGMQVDASNVLGKVGRGFQGFMHSLAFGRIGIGAQANGMGERIAHEAMLYAREREMFGGTAWDMQVNRHAFAKARAQLWTCWQGVLEAARLCDAGEDFTAASSYVKYMSTETADEVAHALTRMFGGSIALTSLPHMQRMVEVYITTVYEGCNEVQLEIIAKALDREYRE